MKFFLFCLFAIFATMANAQMENDFSNSENWEVETYEGTQNDKPGFISGLVNSFFDKIQKEAQKNAEFLQSQLDKAVNKFVSEILLLSEFALLKAKNMERNAEARLISKMDDKTENCKQQYVPSLENAMLEGNKGIEDCIATALTKIAGVKDKVQNFIDAINAEILNLVNILQICVEPFSPIHTAKCMFENMNNITSSLSEIVSNAFKAFKEAIGEFHQIVSTTRACIKATKNQTEAAVTKLATEIDVCLKATDAVAE